MNTAIQTTKDKLEEIIPMCDLQNHQGNKNTSELQANDFHNVRFFIKPFLEYYSYFMFFDNQFCYILGRNYSHINYCRAIFQTVINDSEAEIENLLKLDFQSILCDLRKETIKTILSYAVRYPEKVELQLEEIQPISDIVEISCGLTHDEYQNHKDQNIELYTAISYYQTLYKTVPQSVLIEFNNYLSHLACCCYIPKLIMKKKTNDIQQKEVSCNQGLGHLYRATLDAYKEIVNIEINTIVATKDIFEQYLIIRNNETIISGKEINNDEKKQIVTDYQILIQKLPICY